MSKIKTIPRLVHHHPDTNWEAVDANGEVWEYAEEPQWYPSLRCWRVPSAIFSRPVGVPRKPPKDPSTTLRRIVPTRNPQLRKRRMSKVKIIQRTKNHPRGMHWRITFGGEYRYFRRMPSRKELNFPEKTWASLRRIVSPPKKTDPILAFMDKHGAERIPLKDIKPLTDRMLRSVKEIPVSELLDFNNLPYLKSLKVGERVIEMGKSGMRGVVGTTYMSETPGHGICVKWELPQGLLGTGVTHGTRRIKDVIRVWDYLTTIMEITDS